MNANLKFTELSSFSFFFKYLHVCCLERCQISDDTTLHKLFISKFYVNSCNDIFVFITTRQLISV